MDSADRAPEWSATQISIRARMSGREIGYAQRAGITSSRRILVVGDAILLSLRQGTQRFRTLGIGPTSGHSRAGVIGHRELMQPCEALELAGMNPGMRPTGKQTVGKLH